MESGCNMIAIILAFIILVLASVLMWKEAMAFKKTKDKKHKNMYFIYLIAVVSSVLVLFTVTKQYLDVKAILDNAQTVGLIE